MNFCESIESMSCGENVGRPNPNFQRLIPYQEPPSDEDEGPSSQNPALPEPTEDFVRATIVDVDPLTGGPWLRHRIIYPLSPRNVQAHFSLKRCQKMTNLLASSIREKCLPEPLKEPLENIEWEMKVLWVRGQSPLGSSFNLQPRPIPAKTELKEVENPLESSMYSTLLPFFSGVDPIDMPCGQTTIHVHAELIFDISVPSIQQSIAINQLEKELGAENMLDGLDAQEPCKMRIQTSDSLMELGHNSITIGLLGGIAGGSIDRQPSMPTTALEEAQHQMERAKVNAEEVTKKLRSLAEQLPHIFSHQKSVFIAAQFPKHHLKKVGAAGAVSIIFLKKQQAACEKKRATFHCRPIMYEPLSEFSSADSLTLDKATPTHQASGSQHHVQPKKQTSGESLTLSVDCDTDQAKYRNAILETEEPAFGHM